MSKQDTYDFIRNKNIWYEIPEHEAFFNREELTETELLYSECDVKNGSLKFLFI